MEKQTTGVGQKGFRAGRFLSRKTCNYSHSTNTHDVQFESNRGGTKGIMTCEML